MKVTSRIPCIDLHKWKSVQQSHKIRTVLFDEIDHNVLCNGIQIKQIIYTSLGGGGDVSS